MIQFPRNIGGIIIFCGILLASPLSSQCREVRIPDVSEWKDMGIVLSKGAPGTWDARLTGMLNPCTAIKKNGTYFLYYLGASGDRTTDGGPAFRALGVATSTDGIRFVKYNRNPVLKHIPHDNQEEGIFSAGSSLDANENIALHYGAVWASNATTESVHSHIALAISADGFNFKDMGYIVRWDDPNVWGYGDELSAVGSFRTNGRWYVYYAASGPSVPKWSLGLASGPAADNLPKTEKVVSRLNFFNSGGDPQLIADNKAALFIQTRSRRFRTETRTASLSNPARLGAPAKTYDFGRTMYCQTVFLDAGPKRWFMYYTSGDGNTIRVKTAPARYIDGTPDQGRKLGQ